MSLPVSGIAKFGRMIKRWRSVLFAFSLVLGAGLLAAAVPHFAFAQAASSTDWTNGEQMTATVVNLLASVLNYIVAALGKIMLVIIEMLVVPILNYNSFSTSPVIGLGWSLVRDIMNMFVIIALLFIAIFTIVGNHRAHWEQQIPQLFIAVVMMNFSRTICGILIDISQVIMFTFVNALLDIAAGNFAQLFMLAKFGLFSEDQAIQSVETGQALLSASNNLASAFLQIPLYGTMLGILLLLGLAFLWRIVILWILVILSPAAFLMGGMKGIFSQAGGAAGEWWGKFTAALVMGPMLTFFLWLALAAASSGSIAQSEGFPVPIDSNTYGLSLEVFDSSNLLAIIIGIILLVVGMQQAGAYAGKLEGIASKAINEGVGRQLVSATASSPFTALRYGGRAGLTAARYAGGDAAVRLGKRAGADLVDTAAKGAIGVGEDFGRSVPLVGGVIGRNIVDIAGAAQKKAKAFQHEEEHSAAARVKAMTDDQKAAHLRMIASGATPTTLSLDAMDNMNALMDLNATSAGDRKKFGKILTGKDKDDFDRKSMERADHHKDGFDEAQKAGFSKFKTERADILDEVLGAGEMAKHLDDEKMNPNDLGDRALESDAVMQFLDQKKTKDGRSTVGADLRSGIHGQDKKRAIAYSNINRISNDDLLQPRPATAQPYPVQEVAGNIVGKEIKIEKLTEAHLNGPNGDQLLRGMLQAGVNPNRVGSALSDSADRDRVQQRYRDLAQTAARAAVGTPGSLTNAQQVFADTMEISRLDAATRTREAMEDPGVLDTARVEAADGLRRLLVNRITGAFDEERALRLLSAKPEYAEHFEELVADQGALGVPARQAVTRSLNTKNIEQFTTRHQDPLASAAEQERLERIMNVYADAAEEVFGDQVAAAPPLRNGATPRLGQVDKDNARVYRQLRVSAGIMGTPVPTDL